MKEDWMNTKGEEEKETPSTSPVDGDWYKEILSKEEEEKKARRAGVNSYTMEEDASKETDSFSEANSAEGQIVEEEDTSDSDEKFPRTDENPQDIDGNFQGADENPQSNDKNSQNPVQNSQGAWINPRVRRYQEKYGSPMQETPRQEDNTQNNKDKANEQISNDYDSYHFSENEQSSDVCNEKHWSNRVNLDGGNGLLKKFGICAALAVVFGLVSGLVFNGVTSFQNSSSLTSSNQNLTWNTESSDSQTSSGDSSKADDNSSSGNKVAQSETSDNTVASVASTCMPSVVAISNISVQEVQNYFGGTQSYESESSGSGIIVGQNDTELLIATNNHVISGANSITVTFIDEESVEAQVKGTDSDNDLAVVSVKLSDMKEDTISQIKVATLGDSSELVVGEQVVAIGNALGYGQSVTSGYVSALDREVTVDNVTAKLIQTDAAINPGNSGGALLNMKGELIGINAVKFASSDVEGMGYAIPVSTAEPILNELMSRETRTKVDDDQASYLGITCRNVTSEIQEMYNLPSGVYVDTVTEGSAAEKAGMIKGDIISKFDGLTISSYDELVNNLEYYAAGETVTIIVMRAENGEYKEVELSVTLDKKPDDSSSENSSSDSQKNK